MVQTPRMSCNYFADAIIKANIYVSYTLVYDQMTCKTIDIPITLSCSYSLVQIYKC